MDNRSYGMLTKGNIEDFVAVLREMLTGKRYTFVACNESRHFEPEVRTSQRLENGTNGTPFSVHHYDGWASFGVCDTYGVWGCTTTWDDPKMYDADFKNPYFVFDYNKVTITHRAPAGHLLYWVVAVERE